MKFIHYINSFIYVITLVLYLTIIYGLLSQIALGFLQVVFSLILLIDKKKFRPPGINHLRLYHIIILIYGAIAIISLLVEPNIEESIYILLYVILPMLIATYFVWITYNYNKQVK
ncbi:MAG: hypothetical protein AB3N18_02655 [Allomuricauda sp.]